MCNLMLSFLMLVGLLQLFGVDVPAVCDWIFVLLGVSQKFAAVTAATVIDVRMLCCCWQHWLFSAAIAAASAASHWRMCRLTLLCRQLIRCHAIATAAVAVLRWRWCCFVCWLWSKGALHWRFLPLSSEITACVAPDGGSDAVVRLLLRHLPILLLLRNVSTTHRIAVFDSRISSYVLLWILSLFVSVEPGGDSKDRTLV